PNDPLRGSFGAVEEPAFPVAREAAQVPATRKPVVSTNHAGTPKPLPQLAAIESLNSITPATPDEVREKQKLSKAGLHRTRLRRQSRRHQIHLPRDRPFPRP